MAVLGVLIAFGVLASGWVIANEAGVVQDPTLSALTASFDKAVPLLDEAADLFRQVSERPGTWTAQDSADMRQASELYEQVAVILSATPADANLIWYRDGLAANFRDAASITGGFAALTSQSGQAEIESLTSAGRPIADLKTLSDRFDDQFGSSP